MFLTTPVPCHPSHRGWPHWSGGAINKLVVTIGALVALGLIPMAAIGCSCVSYPSVQWEYDHTDVVFSGLVTDLQWVSLDTTVVTIVPSTRWKGPLDGTVYVIMNPECPKAFCFDSPSNCGEYHQTWVVFGRVSAMPYNGHLAINLWLGSCSNTQLENPGIIAALPPPVLPVPARTHTWGQIKFFYR